TNDGQLRIPTFSKEVFRSLHHPQRAYRLRVARLFIEEAWPSLRHFFANGREVLPRNVSPRLELVKSNTWQSRLFRLASLTWSIPVSCGYGRRLRFLLWDDSNDKLIGMLALGDPV